MRQQWLSVWIMSPINTCLDHEGRPGWSRCCMHVESCDIRQKFKYHIVSGNSALAHKSVYISASFDACVSSSWCDTVEMMSVGHSHSGRSASIEGHMTRYLSNFHANHSKLRRVSLQPPNCIFNDHLGIIWHSRMRRPQFVDKTCSPDSKPLSASSNALSIFRNTICKLTMRTLSVEVRRS